LRLGFLDSAHDEEQDECADGGHYELTDQSIGSEAQQGENPATTLPFAPRVAIPALKK